MLDIIPNFMLICHVYCHRDNEQFRIHVDVNYSYVNFVVRCIIQKNQNTNVFLMCYNKSDYYFGHCASPWYVFYIYVQERCIGKCPCLHRQEYILMPFLRDFLVVQTDSVFERRLGKTSEVMEVTVI